MKMEQRFVGFASLLGVLVYPGFLWVDIKRGIKIVFNSFFDVTNLIIIQKGFPFLQKEKKMFPFKGVFFYF